MKKIIVFAAAVAALALFSSCQKKDKKIKIGVIQLVEHPALDKNYQGFVDGLKAAGYVDGQNIVIDYENAQGEQANCVTIAQKLVNDQSDLIFAIATPAAQAVANMTSDIPILVSSVTDPKTAQLVESNEKPGTNVSGTSDLTPCAAQISLLKRLLPSAKKVAILFCSSEENSRFQANLAEAACQKEGLDFVEATVSNTNEVQQVVQSLVGKVDAIYAPTDNMIASSFATVALVTTPNKIPVICGEEGMVQGGGLATYGINYYELGLQTAKMAVEVLKDGKKPADMPIQYLEKCDFSYNKEVADELGIEIPADLIK
ncbi:MAG: ABC transporter substrate-binding protein [Treponema sp.]|nr:ABC transporter substrate-binding protein [Treponema sp.]MEE3434037.1 ABC transporter substrate-binding protein [Treponema sp.]